MDQSRRPETQLQLPPGFRFHPTDEELVVHYLAKRSEGKSAHPFGVPIIAELDLYKYNPWDLPALAYVGEKEWYFLTPRDRKYPNGARPNRAAASGFWKATGTDKPIHEKGSGTKVGVKKALVFYEGKAPKGVKTNWIMHEYRLAKTSEKAHNPPAARNGSLRMDDWVLCRIYKKSSAAFKTASSGLVPKTEATEDSSIHDVLDSLPDIEDSRAASSEMDSFDSFISDDLEPFGEQSQLGSGNENATEQCQTQYRSTEENSDGAQSGAVQQYPMMDYLVDCFEEQGSRADPDSWFSELFSPATAAAAQESVQRRNHNGLKRMHQEDLQDQGLQSIRKLARLDANDEKGWASYGSLIRII